MLVVIVVKGSASTCTDVIGQRELFTAEDCQTLTSLIICDVIGTNLNSDS